MRVKIRRFKMSTSICWGVPLFLYLYLDLQSHCELAHCIQKLCAFTLFFSGGIYLHFSHFNKNVVAAIIQKFYFNSK